MSAASSPVTTLVRPADPSIVFRAMRVLRLFAKQVVWQVRGLMISNPDLPSEVRSILFVCLGNICRSPFAAKRAEAIAQGRGLSIRVASAGLRPSPDGHCPDDAVSAAKMFAVSLSGHSPVGLDLRTIAEHDLIVVMDVSQLTTLRTRYPQYRSRFVLLALFDGGRTDKLDAYERLNIIDPFGRGPAAFERCYRRLDVAVLDLIGQASSGARPQSRGTNRSESRK